MVKDDRTAPLLSEDEFADGDAGGIDSRVPPLNPEDPLFGLRSSQVEQSRGVFGTNEIVIPETPLWKLFVNQFVGFLPFLIELAAIVSAAVQDWADFGIIVAMVSCA